MARVRLAVAVVCAGVALAGCGAANEAGSPPPVLRSTAVTLPGAASGSVTAPVAAPVAEQLRFTAKTVDGKDFSGQSLAGKAAVLWFWAPWCPRCQGEAPQIAAAAQETAGSVQFVGVAARDEVPAMREFVDRFGLGSFPHLADTDLAVWKRFGVVEQPAYAFVKADGTIETVTKQLYRDDLRDKVRALAG
ncbi:MAG TPA: redoxin domain-containing protein [Actinophytocola sp.]|uniref:redoxin domain-containing protein n=1 Tax=Actinophytocola sp. TaxID=1872138 RepID=UPI002DDD87BE|nr:redoxin domain-containing protein [Actinophytocola sp.]HEV2782231.1 redoxin domain-containing protein [Actinophytocola sp.]